MSHEKSETYGVDGKFINVYGKGLPKAGQQLPGTPAYDTEEEAITAAKARSHSFDKYSITDPSGDYPTLDEYVPGGSKYLKQVERGRNLPKVEPDQPAFNATSEMLRQTGKSAAIIPNDANPEAQYSISDPEEPPKLSQGYSVTEPKPQPTYMERLQGYMPEVTAPKVLGEVARSLNPFSPVQSLLPGIGGQSNPLTESVMAPLNAARDYLLGGTPRETANKLVGPPSVNPVENILGGAVEAGLDLLPTLPFMAVGGKGTRPASTHPSAPAVPTVISRENLNAAVAANELLPKAPEEYLYHGSSKVGADAIEAQGYLAPFNDTRVWLTPDKTAAEWYAKMKGGKLFRVKKADVPPELLDPENMEHGAGFPATSMPTFGPWKNVRIPLDKPFDASAQFKDALTEVQAQPKRLPPEPPVSQGLTEDVAYPTRYSRLSGSITDAARTVGPIGEGIANYADSAYSYRAMHTSTDTHNAITELNQTLGKANLPQRVNAKVQQMMNGEFQTNARSQWGITPAMEEEAFNYAYTNGRMVPTNPRAKVYADIIYKNLLKPASEDPYVRDLPGVTNPLSGETTPFGPAGLFHPQQPVNQITLDALHETQWRALYNRSGMADKVPFEAWKSTVVRLSKSDPGINAAKAKGLENSRWLDLEALGGSPYQWAKKLGYRTDMFQAGFIYNGIARLRGQLNHIQQPINDLIASIPASETATAEWLTKASEHILGVPNKAYDTVTSTTQGIKTASHIMDITMLQKGALANTAQASYILARGGPRATLRGAFDMLTGSERNIVASSGANYQALASEIMAPTGPLATFSSAAYRLYGLSAINRGTYIFAGHVANRYITQLEKAILRNPSSKATQGLIREIKGDPKVILQAGGVPGDMRLKMIQDFAIQSGGGTDVRSVPLWASSQNPWFKLANKYRTFAASNSAEVRRLIFKAPTPAIGLQRAATLLAGSYAIGTGIKSVSDGITELVTGKAPKTKEGIWAALEPVIYGLGTLEGMAVINAIDRPETAVASAVGGPAVGMASSFLQDLMSVPKYGVLSWHAIRQASRRLPGVGPFVGPLVSEYAKEEANNARTLRP